MAIDHFKQRQVACKIVNIKETSRIQSCSPTSRIKAIRHRAAEKDAISKLWREVELLKRVSHVWILSQLEILDTNYLYSPILSESNKFFTPRIHCK